MNHPSKDVCQSGGSERRFRGTKTAQARLEGSVTEWPKDKEGHGSEESNRRGTDPEKRIQRLRGTHEMSWSVEEETSIH